MNILFKNKTCIGIAHNTIH